MDDSTGLPSSEAARGERDQEDREIDPRNVDNSVNTKPEDMRIDMAKLFTQATEQTRMALCVSDPTKEDCPIIYVNEAFVRLTGYQREDVVGSNCRFLQGPDTDPQAIDRIRQALADEKVRVIDILNYKKNGTPFWNALHVGPMYDEQGELQYFYGSQWDVTEMLEKRERIVMQNAVSEELKHRTGNLFAIIGAIVNLTERSSDTVADYRATLTERLGALHRAHKVSLDGDGLEADATSLRSLIDSIVEPYRAGTDRRVEIDGKPVMLARSEVTPIGLALHELATNAVKYGSLKAEGGRVMIEWRTEADDLVIEWTEKGGPAPDPVAGNASGTGQRIMQGVISQLGGSIDNEMTQEGFQARITIPHSSRDQKDKP